mgnify:CR=1 FL=1
MQTYLNFQALQNDNPNLADELLTSFEPGDWQNHVINVWPDLNAFAQYQLIAGAYKDYFKKLDISPEFNPLRFVDCQSFGQSLAKGLNDGEYYGQIDDQIIKVTVPWYN